MNLETVTLGEVSQTEEHKGVSLTCGIKKKKNHINELFTEQK